MKSVFTIAITIVALIILFIAVGFEKTSDILTIVGFVILVIALIIVIIFVITDANRKKKPVNSLELSRELEYFEIKKNKDFQIGRFSKEHYTFLYNSLLEHLRGLDGRLTQISFLNERIYNSEHISDGSDFIIFCKLISLFLGFFFGSNAKEVIKIFKSGNIFLILAVVSLLMVAIIAALLWYDLSHFEKAKHAFYLSVLNQLKEDLNRGLIKNDSSKASDPSEGKPTANLPDADDDSADNSSADD